MVPGIWFIFCFTGTQYLTDCHTEKEHSAKVLIYTISLISVRSRGQAFAAKVNPLRRGLTWLRLSLANENAVVCRQGAMRWRLGKGAYPVTNQIRWSTYDVTLQCLSRNLTLACVNVVGSWCLIEPRHLVIMQTFFIHSLVQNATNIQRS